MSIDKDHLETECRSSGRVPLIRGMKQRLLRRYAEMGWHEVVQCGIWLEPLDVVCGEYRMGEPLYSRRGESPVQHLLRSVGQDRSTHSHLFQGPQRLGHLAIGIERHVGAEQFLPQPGTFDLEHGHRMRQ